MLGERIKKIRKTALLTQGELAEKMGVSTSAIGMYEQNRREPSAEIILKFCDIFDVSSDWLLYGKENTLNQQTVYNKTDEFSLIIDRLKNQLVSQKGLMFHGKILENGDIEKIFDAMKLGAEIAISKSDINE